MAAEAVDEQDRLALSDEVDGELGAVATDDAFEHHARRF
jgi:hypothetical protein